MNQQRESAARMAQLSDQLSASEMRREVAQEQLQERSAEAERLVGVELTLNERLRQLEQELTLSKSLRESDRCVWNVYACGRRQVLMSGGDDVLVARGRAESSTRRPARRCRSG